MHSLEGLGIPPTTPAAKASDEANIVSPPTPNKSGESSEKEGDSGGGNLSGGGGNDKRLSTGLSVDLSVVEGWSGGGEGGGGLGERKRRRGEDGDIREAGEGRGEVGVVFFFLLVFVFCLV